MNIDWLTLGIPLIIGIFASFTAGLIGPLVVVKRVSSLTGGLAHAILAGIGFSTLVHIDPFYGALGSALIIAIIIATLRHYKNQHEDILISMMWTVGMAVGILFLFVSRGYSEDMIHFLFGNILLATSTDLWLLGGLSALISGITWLAYPVLKGFTFDETYITVLNVPTYAIRVLFYSLIAVTTVILTKIVGILLVIALLTIPAATAQFYVKRLSQMQGLSIALATGATLCGSLTSYWIDLPTGPLIILYCTTLYFLGLGLSHQR